MVLTFAITTGIPAITDWKILDTIPELPILPTVKHMALLARLKFTRLPFCLMLKFWRFITA